MRWTTSGALAPFVLFACAGVAGRAAGQVTILEATAWAPIPSEGASSMGAFDEQAVPFFNGPDPIGVGLLFPPNPPNAPAGTCGPTLWHAEAQCCAAGASFLGPMASPVAAYNKGDLAPPSYSFATPGGGVPTSHNAGALASVGLRGLPPVAIALPPRIVLEFDAVKVTEGSGNGTYDECWIETRAAAPGEAACVDPPGVTWIAFAKITGNASCAVPLTCTIGPFHPALDARFVGASGKVRFRFDTIDGVLNNYCGWMVDNARLTNETCSPACAPATPFQPRIGSTGGMARPGNGGFALTLSAAPPSAPTALVLGIQPTFLSLPALGLPSPGCNLCCDPLLVLAGPLTDAAGGASFPAGIPSGATPGATFCAQWAVLDSPSASFFTSSKGDVGIQP